MSAVLVRLTEEEAELLLLAVDNFRRTRLHEYDDESRPGIGRELTTIAKKLREA